MHVSTGTTSPRMIVQLDLYLHLYTSWASINSDCKLVIPSIGTSFTGTVDPQPVFFCSRKKGGCPFKPSHGLCLWPIVVGLVPFGGLLSFYFSAPLCWFSPGAFGTPGTNLFFLKDVCVCGKEALSWWLSKQVWVFKLMHDLLRHQYGTMILSIRFQWLKRGSLESKCS